LEPHLDDDQIEELLRNPTGEDRPLGDGSEIDEHAHSHLQTCTQCQAKLLEGRRAMDRLELLRADEASSPGPQCPPDEVWTEIAAGVSDTGAENYLTHAAHCDHCGPLLRWAVADMGGDLTPEEEARIAVLKSSDAAWQKDLAANLRGVKSRDASKTPGMRTLLWIEVTAMAAVIVAAVLLIGRSWWWPSPERLLAQAYSEHRILELRIPGAEFAPLATERGADRSLMTQNPTLLEAEDLIGRRYRRSPRDPYWLRMQARADLLNGNYAPAIATLTEAQSLEGRDDPSLLTDLASGYFERAEATGKDADYGQAIELLGNVLDKNPHDEVALFNKALVLEKLRLNSQAVDTWEEYLHLFPHGSWADEAKSHESDVQRKLDSRRNTDIRPLLDPGQFVAAAHNADFSGQIDHRVEEYLDAALVTWLPAAFPTTSRTDALDQRRSKARRALAILAANLVERHQDHFLIDLLSASGLRASSSSMARLAVAVRDNHHLGSHDRALINARQSERGFLQAGNSPGMLQALFEQAYAAQRGFDSPSCLKAAFTVVAAAHARRYKWLEIQSLIEEAFCNNIDGRVGLAAREAREAAAIARDAGFHDSFLRASLGAAATEWESGSISQAWSLIMSGLDEYWNNEGSKTRGIAFYKAMDGIAEYELNGHLQSAIIRDYLPSIDPGSDPVEAIMSWYRLANAELTIGRNGEAARAFRQAEGILASAPRSVATEDRRILGIIGLAKVELRAGNPRQAANLLDSIRSSVPRIRESLSVMDFYCTLGQVAESAGEKDAAKRAYGSAIAVSERALSTIESAQDRLSWSRTFTPAYRSLVALTLNSGEPLEALRLWEWYHSIALRNPGSLGRNLPRHPSFPPDSKSDRALRFDAFAPGIPGNLIVYAQLGDRLAVWIRGPDGVTAKWLPIDPARLHRVIEQFVVECSDPTSDQTSMRLHGNMLYAWLIAPIESSLGAGAPVAIEPDGDLERLPMAALVDSTAHYFGEKRAIVLSPGIAYFSLARHGSKLTRADHIVVVDSGASDPVRGLNPDAAVTSEAQDIAALFPGSTLLEGRSISPSSLRRTLAGAEIFHYSGHAWRDGTSSGLVIGKSGSDLSLLTAGDLYGLPFARCQLAVLAGCSTSLGADDRWIDREGMVLPFLNSGVACVVASAWQANSSATRTLMNAFYARIVSGIAIPDALHLASAQVRTNPSTAHPYYWASFEAFGPCTAKS
jgi:CHAT domain-containing protein